MKKTEESIHETDEEIVCFEDSIITILARFISLPLFIILNKGLPDFHWKFNLDRIILILITLILVEVLLHTHKNLTIFLFFVSVTALVYGSFLGEYGFYSLYLDYRNFILSLL